MRSNFVLPAIKVLISTILIILLLKKIGIANLVSQFKTANIWWILVALLIFTTSNLLGSVQWGLMLKGRGISLSFRQVVSFYFVGLFFNNFLIGYVGGDAFRVYDVKRTWGDISSAVSAVFFDRFVGFLVLTTMGLLASFAIINLLAEGSVVFVAAIVFLCWVLALLFLFKQGFAKKFIWLFNLVLPKSIHQRMREIYLGVNAYKHDKKLLCRVFGLSIATQSLRILTHYFAALAVGARAPLTYFCVFIPVIALAASLPISLGGIGVREQSGVYLFSQIGLGTTEVAAFEFLAYLIGVIASLAGGLIFAFRRGPERTSELRFAKHNHAEPLS